MVQSIAAAGTVGAAMLFMATAFEAGRSAVRDMRVGYRRRAARAVALCALDVAVAFGALWLGALAAVQG